MSESIQTSMIRDYLLGELPEQEANQLEIDLLSNDECFEEMKAVENHLVDNYVRNRLPQAQRETFERHYLASPVHVRRVAFARELIGKVDQTRADPNVAKTDERQGFFEWLGIWPLSWQYAFAALVLIFAVGAFWLLRERSRLQTELTQIKTQHETQTANEQAAARQMAEVRDQNKQLSSELEKTRAEKVGVEARPSSRIEKTEPPKILSFALSPILVRSSSDPQVLNLPSDNSVVRLQLRVGSSEKRRFSTTIRTVEGKEIWKQQSVKVSLDGNGNESIITSVPASKLPVGDYILTLTANNPPATQEEINRYFFRVLRK